MTPDENLIAVLRKARDTFQRYGDNHLAKDPPQHGKAEVNYSMVREINEALLAVAEPEPVRLPDTIPSDARGRLRAFLDTLGDREDDSFTSYSCLVGDLRALTKDN